MIKKAISFILIFVTVLLSLVGCGDDDVDACIYVDLSDTPQTLDAQTAESDGELLVVRNIYEGLLRKNEDGKIVNGVCESYKKEGNTYTFKLKNNLKWSDGTALTADDFLFAFQRAVDPKTKAPFVRRLFSIKGAEEIYNSQAQLSELGVKTDGKYTLIIDLKYDDKYFKETLTGSICMPCNRSFFEDTTGKYGLKSEYVLSNGSYELNRWNKEDFNIRLYTNENYKGKFTPKNGSVYITCRSKENTVELLDDKKVDIAFVNNTAVDNLTEDVTVKTYQNICWVLHISEEYDEDIRKSLAMLISDRGYSDKLDRGYKVANSIYPSVLNVSGASGAGIRDYNIEAARNLFADAVKQYEDNKLPSTMLYYYDNGLIKPVVTAIVGHWQQKLSAFVNIKSASSVEALTQDIADNEISFAIYPVSARSSSVDEYLRNFGTVWNGEDEVEIQRQILAKDTMIPIAFEHTNIGYTELITGFVSDPFNGYIDFAFITKK